MNAIDFVKEINALRLQNKGNWYTWKGVVNNKQVVLKGYATWLQVFKVDNLTIPTVSDISVKDFKATLSNAVN